MRTGYLSILISLSLCLLARADTIVTNDGRTLEGTVISATDKEVAIKTDKGVELLKMSDVKTMKRDSAKNAVAAEAKKAPVAPIKSSNDQKINCMKCGGSGIAVTLPCLNCNKSEKPGYKFMGDYWQVCLRCGGSTIAAQFKCGLCGGKGKVYPGEIMPADGGLKLPPNGREWCPTCKGSKYEKWIDCNQCKRSQYPGYLFHGETLSLCNRCNGTTKLPGIQCEKCKGQGTLVIHANAQDAGKEFTQPLKSDK